MMKTATRLIGGLALASMISMGVAAQTPAPAKAPPTPKPAKQMKAAPAPRSDADIQMDIQKRLAAAPHLKSENISVSVSGGVATFTGTVKKAGSKGGVSSLAKAAGAKSVVNNITVEKAAKPAQPAKPVAPTKKP